jgi:SAM-dependent methyltransferase
MARALKPDGRLVITDADVHGYAWLREEQGDVWLGFDRAQVRAWLETAGLVNVLVQDSAETCRCQSAQQPEQAAVSIFIASATRPNLAMDEAVQAHYRQTALGASCGCGPAPASREAKAEQHQSSSWPAAASSCCSPAESAAVPTSSCCSPSSSPMWLPDIAVDEGTPAVQVPDFQVDTDADLALGCGNAVGLAALQPGETVLDIGSGAGADVFPAAGLVGLAGRVIGVDRLPEMLARARATAQRLGVKNVEFRQGDALALPAADGEADVVMSNCVINLVQDKGRAFREAYRVLRPGGRLAISDVVTARPFSPAQRRDAESWASCVAGALAEDEYVALIRQAGFRGVTLARSAAAGAEDGTRVYSLGVKAVK